MIRRRPTPCVVDTNVAVVANGRSTAGAKCSATCANRLSEVVADGHIVLDASGHILAEYRANLNPSGQPGPGDRFYKWVLLNQWNQQRCTRVEITHAADGSIAEFPDHESLWGFDPSDRKFIAVAAVHPDKPCVLQAYDSKWWPLRHAFEKCGISITFLCPREIEAKYQEKHGG